MLVHEQDFYDLAWAYFNAEDKLVHLVFFDHKRILSVGVYTVIRFSDACIDAKKKKLRLIPN